MKKLFLLAPFVLSACASLSKNSYDLPNNLAAIATQDNGIACRFNKQSSAAKEQPSTQWYFWRESERTESRDMLSNQGEIWERNKKGQLFYTRVFFNERVALEFVPGDLAAIGSTTNWEQLASLIDPSMLGKELTLNHTDKQNGNAVEYYVGTVNGVATEVDWLPSLQLPVRLLRKSPEGDVTLTLSTCSTKTGLDKQPISKAELDSLRRLDYTDFGDMEDDPMVRHLEQLMGGHDHHGH